jgi:hypothetical protein
MGFRGARSFWRVVDCLKGKSVFNPFGFAPFVDEQVVVTVSMQKLGRFPRWLGFVAFCKNHDLFT